MEVIAEALRVSKREKKNGLFQLMPKQESQSSGEAKETRTRPGQDVGNRPNFRTEP